MELQSLGNLVSHRRCVELVRCAWAGFLGKREERLQPHPLIVEASEKVAENILEELFTTVLDWPLADIAHQVDPADVVLTDHGIRRLILEVSTRLTLLDFHAEAMEAALRAAIAGP